MLENSEIIDKSPPQLRIPELLEPLITQVIQEVADAVLDLWNLAESLIGNDELRNAEIRNIQSIIYAALDEYVNGDWSMGDYYVHGIGERLQQLQKNPDSAGNHEQQRQS